MYWRLETKVGRPWYLHILKLATNIKLWTWNWIKKSILIRIWCLIRPPLTKEKTVSTVVFSLWNIIKNETYYWRYNFVVAKLLVHYINVKTLCFKKGRNGTASFPILFSKTNISNLHRVHTKYSYHSFIIKKS